jgi:Sulfotransferase family
VTGLADAPWRALRAAIRTGARVADRPVRPFLRLDANRLIEMARRRARADELEDTSFLEGLHRLVDSLETEADVNLIGRIAVREDIIRLLANRFRVEKDRRRDAGIAAESVPGPIFITGMPRSGSTLLHGLLAQDPANRVPQTWEMLNPSPAPRRATYDHDPRIAKVERELWWFQRLSPSFQAIHDVGARMPEECVIILAHSFVGSQFASMYDVPSYSRWCDMQDARPRYELHRRFLQHLQHHCRGERWVLKAPVHLPHLGALLSVYPDARVVMTHREPLEVLGSECSLITTLRLTFTDTVDPRRVGREVADLMVEEIRRGLEARDASGTAPEQFVDLVYADFAADPMADVRRIYSQFGMTLAPAVETRMRRFLADTPKEKYGAHRYALAEFGLDAAEEGERYRAYRDRFLGPRPRASSPACA